MADTATSNLTRTPDTDPSLTQGLETLGFTDPGHPEFQTMLAQGRVPPEMMNSPAVQALMVHMPEFMKPLNLRQDALVAGGSTSGVDPMNPTNVGLADSVADNQVDAQMNVARWRQTRTADPNAALQANPEVTPEVGGVAAPTAVAASPAAVAAAPDAAQRLDAATKDASVFGISREDLKQLREEHLDGRLDQLKAKGQEVWGELRPDDPEAKKKPKPDAPNPFGM